MDIVSHVEQIYINTLNYVNNNNIYLLWYCKNYLNNFKEIDNIHTYPELLFKPTFKITYTNFNIIDIDIPTQINNIITNNSIILKPWCNQYTIIVGCGHKLHYNCIIHKPSNEICDYHTNSYTFDINYDIMPDCILLVGHASMAQCIPEAKHKIFEIYFEGLLTEETYCLYNDFMYLLANEGIVYIDNYPKLIKINDTLYLYDTNEKYHAWTYIIKNEKLYYYNFGHDIFEWSYQMEKIENEKLYMHSSEEDII
jgi:hypothetical protein